MENGPIIITSGPKRPVVLNVTDLGRGLMRETRLALDTEGHVWLGDVVYQQLGEHILTWEPQWREARLNSAIALLEHRIRRLTSDLRAFVREIESIKPQLAFIQRRFPGLRPIIDRQFVAPSRRAVDLQLKRHHPSPLEGRSKAVYDTTILLQRRARYHIIIEQLSEEISVMGEHLIRLTRLRDN